MTITAQAFVAIDTSLADRMFRIWKLAMRTRLIAVGAAYDRDGDIDAAMNALDNAEVIYQKLESYIEFATKSAVLFGASRVGGKINAKALGKNPALVRGMRQAMAHLRIMIIRDTPAFLKDRFRTLFQALDEKWYEEQDAQFQKRVKQARCCGSHRKLALTKAAVDAFQDKPFSRAFQSFADDAAQKSLQIASSLHTARMANWGYTIQAEVQQVTTYRINETLDVKTCPVCEILNGREFKVTEARSTLETVLGVEDPQDLKSIAPWPDQDEASVEALRAMSDEDIISNGWHVPPYHPWCRGFLEKGETTVEQVDEDRTASARPTTFEIDLPEPEVSLGIPEVAEDLALEPALGLTDDALAEDLLPDPTREYTGTNFITGSRTLTALEMEAAAAELAVAQEAKAAEPYLNSSPDTFRPTQDGLAAYSETAYQTLPISTRSGVRSYTGSSYRAINKALGYNDDVKLKEWEAVITKIDQAIAAMPVTTDNIVFYKAVDFARYEMPEISNQTSLAGAAARLLGKTLTDVAFNSTSLSQGTAEGFLKQGRLMFRVKLPKGSKGIWVGNDVRSKNGDESEMILPRGTTYTINAITPVKAANHYAVQGMGWADDYLIIDVTATTPKV